VEILRVPGVTSAADVHFQDGDVLLLYVKSQDTDRALVDIRAAGGNPRTLPVLRCENDVSNEQAAIRYFSRVYGVLVVVPGVFLNPELGSTIVLAPRDSSTSGGSRAVSTS
jgi:hypothetical protein